MIGQDRANVHRSGITQPGDERDPWFGSGEMRTALESWVRDDAMSPATQAAVMAGGARILVDVLGQGIRANDVRVRPDSAAAGGEEPAGPGGRLEGDPGRGDLVISPE